MKRFGPALALLLVLVGCLQPQNTAPVTGALVLHLQAPIRTLGPDWPALVQSYQATLSSHDGYADVTASVSGSTTLVVNGVRSGTWDISVVGLDSSALTVVQATLTNQTIPSAALALALAPTKVATGGYSLSLRFPWFSASPDRITRITGQLTKPDLTPVGAAFDVTPVDLGGTAEAVFADTGVASGVYRLALTLFRGTDPAKYVVEAVNVYDNVVSNRWIDSAGVAQTARLLGAAEFSSTNTDLASLDLVVDGLAQTLTPAFDPSMKTGYTLSIASTTLAQSLVPTATPSLPGTGQHIEFSLASASVPPFTLVQGPNLVQVRVVVSRNGQELASSVYEVTIVKEVRTTGLALTPATLTLATNAAPTALTAQVFPVEADNQGVTFMSSDPTLATVDLAGVVHPILPGTVTITATSDDGGFTATAVLTLTPSQFFLQATDGPFWTNLSGGPTAAPPGSLALAGDNNHLLALDDTATLWEFNGGFWSKLTLRAPPATRWIALGKNDVLLAATPTQLFFVDQGLWSKGIPVPPVAIQGLVSGQTDLRIWGVDGRLWSFAGGLWTKESVVPPALAAEVTTQGSTLLARVGPQYFALSGGVWVPSTLAVPQTASTTFAFGKLVSLIVR